jgi:toxin CptA
MQLPLSFSLIPSRRLVVALAVVHVAAYCGLLVALSGGLPAGGQVALVAGLSALPFMVSIVSWMKSLLGAKRWDLLTLREDGVLDYQCLDGTTGCGRVDARSTVTPWLVVILLREDDGRRSSLTLLPDALRAQDFRRLRLWLRWRAVCAAGGSC